MRPRKPRPPLDNFVDGAVWRVVVKHQEGMVLAFPLVIEREYLLLVRAGIKGKPWARTRLAVGDLEHRTRQQIYADFVTLMRQAPPVERNYRLALDNDRGDAIRWLAYERTMI